MPRHSGAFVSCAMIRTAESPGSAGTVDCIWPLAAPMRITIKRAQHRLPLAEGTRRVTLAREMEIRTAAGSRHGDKTIPRISAKRGNATGWPFVSGKGRDYLNPKAEENRVVALLPHFCTSKMG